MCDAHIAPKEFNEIAFGAEDILPPLQGRWLRRFAPKSEGFIQISANSLQNPSVGYADSFPKRESHIISSDLGSMWASTPTNCAFAITTYIKLLFRSLLHA